MSPTQVKYLGIIVDQHLKWNKHISFLCNRLCKTIHKFSILRSYLPVNVLRIVYLALVQSIIQYGILGWGGIGKSNLTPLILLQKRIIKICLHKPLDYPTKLIYQEFGVLNIEQIYKYILLSYFQKNRNNFKIVPHYYSTRKNEVYFLQETKCHTTAGMKHSINFRPRLYSITH